MAFYVPTVQTEYFQQGLFDEKTWSALLASGVIDLGTLESARLGGDTVTVPTVSAPEDFARIDITSDTDMTPTAVATLDDKAVVCRDAVMQSWTEADRTRSGGLDIDQIFSKMLGEKVAKRICKQLFRVLAGALTELDTPSADAHIKDIWAAPESAASSITVNTIRQAKMLLGDESGHLSTLVIHSTVMSDLLRSFTEGYSSLDTVSGEVIKKGSPKAMLGIDNIIVTDLIPVVESAGSSVLGDKYPTFLLGPKSCYVNFQREPTIERDSLILKPATKHIQKFSMSYITHLKGMKWTASGTNPTDLDLIGRALGAGGPDHWAEAFVDHREVKAAMIISSGGFYA